MSNLIENGPTSEPTASEVMQDDILEILRALGLSDHARPASPHRVVQDEILPAIRRLRAALSSLVRLDAPREECVSDTTINTLIDNLVTASDSAGFFRGMGSHHLDGLLRTRAEAREALKVVIAAALSALPARTDPEPETP